MTRPDHERRLRLGRRTIDALLPSDTREIFWDDELSGFGLRVEPSGRKTFIIRHRPGGGRNAPKRFQTIGRCEILSPEQARLEARKILAAGSLGLDPAAERLRKRKEMKINELCDFYLEIGVELKKPLTIYGDRGRIERHIKPLLGTKRVSEVTSADIEKAMRDIALGKTRADIRTGVPRARIVIRGGKGAATRIIGLLGGIFPFAQRQDIRADNPCRGVRRYAEKTCERFLSVEELARLGAALAKVESSGANANAINIIRLLAMTGARRNEIAGLRWEEVDLDRACLRLRDSKTGARVNSLGEAAIRLLREIPVLRNSEFVFPAKSGDGHYIGLKSVWQKILREASPGRLRLHDLRHSFASIALAEGDTLPIIGALLGHVNARSTSRYAHLADDPKRKAAQRISTRIADAMNLEQGQNVIPLKRSLGG